MRVEAVNTNRQFYRFADFRGVDYSSSPLEVQGNRATDMANLILRDGTLHKRNGFEQLHYLGGTEEVKGAWLMKRDNQDVLIYIQGQQLYEFNIDENENTTLYTSADGNISDTAMAFISGDALYILCGEYLQIKYKDETYDIVNLLDTSLKRAYIPITTRNIHPEHSTATDRERILDKPINALTGWRKNILKWNDEDMDDFGLNGSQYLFYLDGYSAKPIKNENGSYDNSNAPTLYLKKAEWGTDEFEEIGSFVAENGATWVLNVNDDYGLSSARISCGGKSYGNAFIIIYKSTDDVDKPLEKGDEIIIEFKAVNNEGKVESITSVDSVGAIFGNDGRSDRLFIATGNFVRYTENTADYLPNFTYLPVTNFVRCGSAGKVTAMMRLADGRLAVFKDSENDKEPSLYYIAGKTIEAYTDVKGVVAYDDLFTVQAGNIEEKCPTPNAIATLAGDSLFVSQSGVYGIELSGNVAADDRFARERSRIINTKLTKFDLANAKAVVYDNRYYLAVGGEQNEVYIADARYKYTAEGDMSNTFNYEWFRWTDVPVASWLIKDNELWFISKDNYLCRFTNEYYDKYLTSNGNETIAKVNGKYVVAINKDFHHIVQKALYAEVKYTIDGNERNERWNIKNLKEYVIEDSPVWAFDVPLDEKEEPIISVEGFDVDIAFIVPVKAYWKSSVTALGSSIHRKNMYSLSVVVEASKQSEVSVGYTTRLRNRTAITAEGTNAFDFGDISFELFGNYQMFSFDAGGFVSAYRQRVFERNFVYAQLFFSCDSPGDCIVAEMSVEYTMTRKNIGVG